jgi:L-ribulose-5-phosphate 4-epimerase
MRLAKLREEVLEANLDLVRRGLVLRTFGNASGVARKEGLIVIKPSGVPYDRLKSKDLVVTDLEGQMVEGRLRPCHRVVSGPQTNSVLRHHARRLFPWSDSIDRRDDG